jgi:hypothetical protein
MGTLQTDIESSVGREGRFEIMTRICKLYGRSVSSIRGNFRRYWTTGLTEFQYGFSAGCPLQGCGRKEHPSASPVARIRKITATIRLSLHQKLPKFKGYKNLLLESRSARRRNPVSLAESASDPRRLRSVIANVRKRSVIENGRSSIANRKKYTK